MEIEDIIYNADGFNIIFKNNKIDNNINIKKNQEKLKLHITQNNNKTEKKFDIHEIIEILHR